MTMTGIGVVSFSLLAGFLPAQQWSLTGNVLSGVVTAYGSQGLSSVTIPAGPTAPATWAVGNAGGFASASWSPASAGHSAIGFEVRAYASTPASPSTCLAAASLSIVITIANSSGVPQPGALRLRGDAVVDVGVDGTDELSGSMPDDVVLPVVVPVSGLQVSVGAIAGAASFSGGPGETSLTTVTCEFFPGQTAVGRHTLRGLDPFDCLTVTPMGGDRWQLDAHASGWSPVGTIVGFYPVDIPISLSLHQLVSFDAWLPSTNFVLDLPPLPPGFELYAQAVLVSQADWGTTNSVRAVWF